MAGRRVYACTISLVAGYGRLPRAGAGGGAAEGSNGRARRSSSQGRRGGYRTASLPTLVGWVSLVLELVEV